MFLTDTDDATRRLNNNLWHNSCADLHGISRNNIRHMTNTNPEQQRHQRQGT